MISARQLRLSRILTILYVIAVLWLCLADFSQGPTIFDKTLWGVGVDKIVHGLMFLPFPVLTFFSFFVARPRSKTALMGFIALSAAMGMAFGGGIELLQGWLTDVRSCELADFRADVIGVAEGEVIVLLLAFQWKRRRQTEH